MASVSYTLLLLTFFSIAMLISLIGFFRNSFHSYEVIPYRIFPNSISSSVDASWLARQLLRVSQNSSSSSWSVASPHVQYIIEYHHDYIYFVQLDPKNESEPAFDVVCPSLPGFGFSDAPPVKGYPKEKINI